MKELPTTQMVAMGFVDFTEMDRALFQEIRTKIRKEIRPYALSLKGNKSSHSLRRKFKPAMKNRHDKNRPKMIANGSMELCCKHALHVIDPETYKAPPPEVTTASYGNPAGRFVPPPFRPKGNFIPVTPKGNQP
jgi:hypothetical protein